EPTAQACANPHWTQRLRGCIRGQRTLPRGLATKLHESQKRQRQRNSGDSRFELGRGRRRKEDMTVSLTESIQFRAAEGSRPVEWRIAPGITPYDQALTFMEERAAAIREGTAGELIWLVEHPP